MMTRDPGSRFVLKFPFCENKYIFSFTKTRISTHFFNLPDEFDEVQEDNTMYNVTKRLI